MRAILQLNLIWCQKDELWPGTFLKRTNNAMHLPKKWYLGWSSFAFSWVFRTKERGLQDKVHCSSQDGSTLLRAAFLLHPQIQTNTTNGPKTNLIKGEVDKPILIVMTITQPWNIFFLRLTARRNQWAEYVMNAKLLYHLWNPSIVYQKKCTASQSQHSIV